MMAPECKAIVNSISVCRKEILDSPFTSQSYKNEERTLSLKKESTRHRICQHFNLGLITLKEHENALLLHIKQIVHGNIL